MESWKQSGFVALVVVVAIVIGGGLQMWSLGHTPTRAPAADACPVTQDICDFGVTVERQLQAQDYAAVTATSPGLQPALMDFVTRSLGAKTPRLASIGCPVGPEAGTCETSFALVFTTLEPGADSAGHGGILILRYERTAAGSGPSMALNMVNTIEEPAQRYAALAGGSGEGPIAFGDSAADRVEVEFRQFSTGAPIVPPGTSPAGAVPGARDVRMAPDGGLPEGSAFLIGTTGYGHGEGGFFRLRKVWQLATAGLTGSAEAIPSNGHSDANSSVLGVAQSEDGTVLWMSRCEGAGCSSHIGGVASATTTFLRSLDGGVSWQEVLRRDGAWWLRAAVGAKGYALNFDGVGGVMEVPSGDTVPVPSGAEGIDILPYQGKLVWMSRDGHSLIDAAGTATVPFAMPVGLALTGEYANWTTESASLTAWGLTGGDPQEHYIAVIRGNTPTPFALLHVPITASPVSRWLNADTLVLTADYPGTCAGGTTVGGSLPLLLSIGTATAHFVTGPLANCDSAGGQVVLGAWWGLSAQVHTPGDCLNLRQRPQEDAPVVECLADGVLLQAIGKDGVPAGWLPVTAPSGASGWVSAAFVLRQ